MNTHTGTIDSFNDDRHMLREILIGQKINNMIKIRRIKSSVFPFFYPENNMGTSWLSIIM